jgi:HAD superfamily hydrolase (TIGR01549 family)
MFDYNIQAIFFDFDGTLRHSEPSSMETFYRIAAEEGYPTTPEQRLRGERWVNAYWAESNELREDVARYGTWQDNGEFWRNHARRHLTVLGSAEAHAEEIATRVTQRMWAEYEPVDCVSPAVPPVLQHLREAGYSLAVVSNRSQPYDTLVETLQLSTYFEFVMAAGELGTFKPDPAIFHHAAQRAGVEPDQTVYVGDNFYADVLGARAAGMHPVLYDPKGIYPEADCVVIRDITHLEPLFLACGDDRD